MFEPGGSWQPKGCKMFLANKCMSIGPAPAIPARSISSITRRPFHQRLRHGALQCYHLGTRNPTTKPPNHHTTQPNPLGGTRIFFLATTKPATGSRVEATILPPSRKPSRADGPIGPDLDRALPQGGFRRFGSTGFRGAGISPGSLD